MITTWDLSIGNKQYIRNSLKASVINKGKKLGFSSCEENVRDIVLSDLGLDTWDVPKRPPGTVIKWIDYNISNKILLIYKIVQLSSNPTVNEINIYGGGKTVKHSLSSLYGVVPIIKNPSSINELSTIINTNTKSKYIEVTSCSTCPYMKGRSAFRPVTCTKTTMPIYGEINSLPDWCPLSYTPHQYQGLEPLRMDGWIPNSQIFLPNTRITIDLFTDIRKKGKDKLVLVGHVLENG